MVSAALSLSLKLYDIPHFALVKHHTAEGIQFSRPGDVRSKFAVFDDVSQCYTM